MAQNILQIYAQTFEHQEVWVCGDREGLTRLRSALTKALETSRPQSAHSYCVDGEGYAAIVLPVEGSDLLDLALPYTDRMYDEGTPDSLPRGKKAPFQLLKTETYRALVRPPPEELTEETWSAELWREDGPMCTRCHTSFTWEGDDPECEEDAICHDCAWKELQMLRGR